MAAERDLVGRGRKRKTKETRDELKRIEKAMKTQEKIVAMKSTSIEQARLQTTHGVLEQAISDEDRAIAVLERIRANKERAEAELKAAELKDAERKAAELRVAGIKPVELEDHDVDIETPVSEMEIPDLELEGEEGEDAIFLERYPVNAPYAYVTITATIPPVYKVSEVKLSRGEAVLLEEIKTRLYESLDVNFKEIEDPNVFLKEKAKEIIKGILKRSLGSKSLNKVMYFITRDFIDYGKLDPVIRDKMTEDISVDGPDIPMYIYHRHHGSIRSNVMFNQQELDALIYKLAQRAGRHISLSKPLLSASLPNKDRIELSIGNEVTTKGSTLTIRRFKDVPITPVELVTYGTFSVEMMAYLWMAVENGFNLLVSGATASGKTTTLNALSMFIPPESKIVSIEDTREINLMHENWIPGVTRESEGAHGTIEMFDLLRSALRQRPEYILVGEVRGREAYTLFQAMATGHITLSTVHADSADAVVRRLTKPPIDVPLMLLDSLDIITIQRMVKVADKGVRRCVQVIEITGIDFDAGLLKTNELFNWRPDTFVFTGESKIFEDIMATLNMSEEELAEEFAHRVRIIEWMKMKGLDDFESLARILFEYNTDPGAVEKRMMMDEGIEPKG
jgi:flagellar protein FlaI